MSDGPRDSRRISQDFEASGRRAAEEVDIAVRRSSRQHNAGGIPAKAQQRTYGPEWRRTQKNSHQIIHCPTSEGVSERSGACEQSKQCETSKQVSGASKWPSTSVCILGCKGKHTDTQTDTGESISGAHKNNELTTHRSIYRLTD